MWNRVAAFAGKGEHRVAKAVADQCIPLHAGPIAHAAYDEILKAIGDQVDIVMIGEASHGTHEFYHHRAELTKRLIQEKGFNLVCWEADWPDTYRVDRFVRGLSEDKDAEQALSEYKRFPRWMWRNDVVRDFITWLRQYNDRQESQERQVGVYGIDVYSLNSSMEAVVEYLEKVDPEAAKQARECYRCFDQFGYSPEQYARGVGFNLQKGCRNEVVQVLTSLLQKSKEYASKQCDGDALFYAQQNALVVKNAERYYAKMLDGGDVTWNLRDTHMRDTLNNLLQWKSDELGPRKAIVWAHNSHLGDARETYMRARSQVNLGQLARERFGMDRTFNIGFTTYAGSVTAADSWGKEPKYKTVRKGLSGSVESLMHDAVMELHHARMRASNDQFTPNFALLFRANSPSLTGPLRTVTPELHEWLREPRLQRAIGVVYRPDTELQSHYFDARVSNQFDALIHIDVSRALHPLEKGPQWVEGEKEHVPPLFPYAL